MRQPKNVKELLVELKDASELMVDLAYAAVFFNEEKLAREVGRLEDRMGAQLRKLRIMAMLAARSPEDAEGMAGVLWIADAIEQIGDAASDIARVVAARLGHPRRAAPGPASRRRDDRAGEGPRGRARRRASPCASSPCPPRPACGSWRSAADSTGSSTPGPEDVVSVGDVLLIRGPEEGVNLVRALAGAPPLPAGTRRRHAGALGAGSGRRHPGGAEGPRRGGGGARLLVAAVQQPRARGGGRRARGPQRPAPRRARVVGAARGAGGAQPRRAPGPPAAGERQRVRVRRRPRHDVVRGARRAAASGGADGAGGDRGDERGDHRATRFPRRRAAR